MGGRELSLKPYKIKTRQTSFPFPCVSKIFMNSAAMVLYARCNQKLVYRVKIIEKWTVTLQRFIEEP